MNLNNNKIFITDELLFNQKISNQAIPVFCTLQSLISLIGLDEQCITINQLVHYISGNLSEPRKSIYNNISKGLDNLIEQEYVREVDCVLKNHLLDCSNLRADTINGEFTVITFEEVKRIITAKDVNQYSLLRYFIYLIRCISSQVTVYLEDSSSKNRVVAIVTIDYLSKTSGLSAKTIIEYNKVLESIGLIYIARQDDFLMGDNNELRKLPNVYGRPCDKKYVDACAENQRKSRKSYGFLKSKVDEANHNRRLAQIYIQLSKGNDERYSEKEISDTYRYVLSENTKYEEYNRNSKSDRYSKHIRDIDIFEKYDFLFNSDSQDGE